MVQAYLLCEECGGDGHVTCSHCDCQRCHSVGELVCIHCQGGLVDCLECGGTGRIPAGSAIYSFSSAHQLKSARLVFTAVSGARFVKVAVECHAPNVYPPMGASSAPIVKVRGGWFALGAMVHGGSRAHGPRTSKMLAPEDLRFEHEKLRSKRANFEIELSRLHLDRDAEQRETDYWSSEFGLRAENSTGKERPRGPTSVIML